MDHRNGDGARWDSHPTQSRVYFKGVGHVKVKQHRPVTGRRITRVSVKREGRHWYVTLAAEQDLPAPLPKTGVTVGIDLATGPNGLAYTSLGERIGNPAYGKASLDRLADAQQALSRTQRGSNRRRKARERVAGVYRKVSNQRHDYLHKTARRLVDSYDVIVAEHLNTAGMTFRAARRPDGAGGYEPECLLREVLLEPQFSYSRPDHLPAFSPPAYLVLGGLVRAGGHLSMSADNVSLVCSTSDTCITIFSSGDRASPVEAGRAVERIRPGKFD